MERTSGQRTQACLRREDCQPACKVRPIQNPKSFHQQALQVLPYFLMQVFPPFLRYPLHHFRLPHFLTFLHFNLKAVALRPFNWDFLNCFQV
jgi:hypothetical protein